METSYKISNEKKDEFINKISTPELKEFIDSILKAGDKTHDFEVVISTENVDRHGDVIKLDAWDIEHYMKSPVVLWGHDYYQMPIGITLSIEFRDGKMIAKGKFADTEMGKEAKKLYDAGMLRATSVGFIQKEREGNIIIKAELLEWSFVSVPANPYALSTLVENGISINDMIAKGFLNMEVKDVEEKKEKEEEKDITTEDEEEDDNEKNDITEDEKAIKKIEIIRDIKSSLSALEDLCNSKDLERQGDEELDDEEKEALEFTEKRILLQKASGMLADVLGEIRRARG